MKGLEKPPSLVHIRLTSFSFPREGETAAAVEPWAVSGGYVNYMQAEEPIERVRAAFGEQAFERLQALKSRYDPDNVLHRNQNIPPALGPGQA